MLRVYVFAPAALKRVHSSFRGQEHQKPWEPPKLATLIESKDTKKINFKVVYAHDLMIL